MVPAKVGQVAHRFESILRKDKCSAGHSLKSAKDLKDVFAVIRNRHGLAIWSDICKLLDDFPGLRIDNTTPAVSWFWIQDRDKHLAAVD